jgi:hypothetical protein
VGTSLLLVCPNIAGSVRVFHQQANNFQKMSTKMLVGRIFVDSKSFIPFYPTGTPCKPVDYRYAKSRLCIVIPLHVVCVSSWSLSLSQGESSSSEVCASESLQKQFVSYVLVLFAAMPKNLLGNTCNQNTTARDLRSYLSVTDHI